MSLLSAGDIALLHDTMAGVSNARVTQIATPGTLGDSGDPGTPVVAWSGSAVAFLLVVDHEELSGGVQVQVKATKLRVFDEAGAPVAQLRSGADWAASTVVVEDRRQATASTLRWTIVGIEHESDQTLNSVLLTLSDGRAA
jgi:hypothetical protein